MFPFYNEEYKHDDTPMKSWEEKKRSQHAQTAFSFEKYRKDCGFDDWARRGMKIHNVVQTAKPDDEVSRIFLGMTRTVIDRGHEQMTEGMPGFSFSPKGQADRKKVIIWENLIKNNLSETNYRAHQNLGFRDLLTMGSMVYEQYNEYPTKTVLVPNKEKESGYESIVVRDYSKHMTGIRQINPLDAWRDPNVSDPTQVSSCWKRQVFSWNQFAQDIGRMQLVDGSSPYKHLYKVKKGTHVAVFTYQNEITGEMAKYAFGFGNEEDGYSRNAPELKVVEQSPQIYYKPMKIVEIKEDDKVIRSEGLSISGKCTLRWGTYLDAYDSNYRGTHSVYGMGLPQRLEAEDMVLQTIFNQNLDNFRWANSGVLSYEGNNGDSYLDIDANRLYGWELIEGKITPQNLGNHNQASYQAMKADLEEGIVPASGINFRAMIGDTSKTAFEFGQRIKLSNRSAEQTLRRLEDELFKPIGELLLGSYLSNLTVDEYEKMTEEQVEIAKKKIKEGSATREDYRNLETDMPEMKVQRYIKIQGYKAMEDFTSSSKRKLDEYSISNTLSLKRGSDQDVAWVPMTKEHVMPADYIERGLMPDVLVETKSMLGDMKAQDAQNMQTLTAFITQLVTAGFVDPKKIEWQKFIKEYARFANISDEQIFAEEATNKMKMDVESVLEQMKAIELSQSPNVQQAPPEISPMDQSRTPITQPEGSSSTQNALERATAGML